MRSSPLISQADMEIDSNRGEHAERNRFAMLSIICVCVVLLMSTWFSTAAVVPQLRGEWQISDSSSAWLAIAVQLGFVAGALLIASTGLADLVSPRRLIASAAIGAATANIALIWTSNVGSAIGFRLLTGVFMAGIYPPALKLVATWYLKGRGVALGAVIGALTLGSAFPHLVNFSHGIPWRAVILTTSIATFVGCLGVSLLVQSGPYPHEFRSSRRRSEYNCLIVQLGAHTLQQRAGSLLRTLKKRWSSLPISALKSVLLRSSPV
jgi:MFS family permease